jgi:hypothetical protein
MGGDYLACIQAGILVQLVGGPKLPPAQAVLTGRGRWLDLGDDSTRYERPNRIEDNVQERKNSGIAHEPLDDRTCRCGGIQPQFLHLHR